MRLIFDDRVDVISTQLYGTFSTEENKNSSRRYLVSFSVHRPITLADIITDFPQYVQANSTTVSRNIQHYLPNIFQFTVRQSCYHETLYNLR
jgi:hypothetical protein